MYLHEWLYFNGKCRGKITIVRPMDTCQEKVNQAGETNPLSWLLPALRGEKGTSKYQLIILLLVKVVL